MRHFPIALTLTALLAALPLAGQAQQQAAPEAKPANPQVIEPEVDRRDVKLPRIPSNDFEAGLFGGTYSVQNFGASGVGGIRLGYHITEDFFAEGVYGQTKVSDELFRQILPGGVYPNEREKLTYYNISLGYNLLPGEVFIGSNHAFASSIYLIGGVGSTKIVNQRRQTFNFGLGARLMLADWAAVQVDLRDHVFPLDILGKRQTTQNLELTAGLTFFF